MAIEEFPRMNRLPPYVFAKVNNIKMEARRRGEDIIDLGMGNPDLPTPQHIVDKLVEAAKKGQPSIFRVHGDHQAQARHRRLVQAALRRGHRPGRRGHRDHRGQGRPFPPGPCHHQPRDVVLVPNPTYPIHPDSVIISGGQLVSIPMGPDRDFFDDSGRHEADLAEPENARDLVSPQPHHPVVDRAFFKGSWISPRSTTCTWSTILPMPTWSSTGIRRPASCRCPAPRRSGWSFTAVQELLHGRLARGVCGGQRTLVHALTGSRAIWTTGCSSRFRSPPSSR